MFIFYCGYYNTDRALRTKIRSARGELLVPAHSSDTLIANMTRSGDYFGARS